MLPVVADRDVDIPGRERGQRLLGLRPRSARSAAWVRTRRSASITGSAIRSATDWNVAIRTRPATVPDAAARSASARAARSSSTSACSTSTRPGSVRRTPRPERLEQAHAGLPFEQRELLGDGARRELKGVGDRGDRAALAELLQQPQPSPAYQEALRALGDGVDRDLRIVEGV